MLHSSRLCQRIILPATTVSPLVIHAIVQQHPWASWVWPQLVQQQVQLPLAIIHLVNQQITPVNLMTLRTCTNPTVLVQRVFDLHHEHHPASHLTHHNVMPGLAIPWNWQTHLLATDLAVPIVKASKKIHPLSDSTTLLLDHTPIREIVRGD